MNRREFLKLGSVAAALPAVRAVGAGTKGELPPWAEAKIDEAVARRKLRAMGVAIDTLSDEQAAYLGL